VAPERAAPEEWTHHDAVVNGVRLHYVEAGSGPLVVLLHGFPEFWYSWRRQIPVLTAAGYRVIAPDMRGYNISEKPRGIAPYRTDVLAGDVAALIRHAGVAAAVVVGHDWGASVAWQVAMRYPDLVKRLVALAAPHPIAFRRAMTDPSQLRRSWYVFFFQLPWLPEAVFRRRNFASLVRTLHHDPVHPGAFTHDDIARYRGALGQPGAVTAAINYYRAALRYGLHEEVAARPVEPPTLVIWADRDRYLGPHLAEGYERWGQHVRLVHVPDASHWLQNDVPDRVNELVLEFLRED